MRVFDITVKLQLVDTTDKRVAADVQAKLTEHLQKVVEYIGRESETAALSPPAIEIKATPPAA